MGQAAIALMPAAEQDIPDTIDREISDESGRRHADTEEEENRSTVVMEKHESWTVSGGGRSIVAARDAPEERVEAMECGQDLSEENR